MIQRKLDSMASRPGGTMDTALKERLKAELAEEKARLEYLQGLFQAEAVPDQADEASRMETVSSAGRLAERSAKKVAALQRLLRDGSEARFCEDCGQPIPLERLLAAPESVCCRNCQAEREGEN
jgi:DnaK suppressor protein